MLTEAQLSEIINKYSTSNDILMNYFTDGGTEPLWARFRRAASNQISNGPATVSRYAIWANTVRDNIIEAIFRIDNEINNDVIKILIKSANSLSAFSEVQSYMDPLEIRR